MKDLTLQIKLFDKNSPIIYADAKEVISIIPYFLYFFKKNKITPIISQNNPVSPNLEKNIIKLSKNMLLKL